MMEITVGHGYDIHRLERSDDETGIVLGGVRIPCGLRLVAHSDGDVAIHALCDALLGAAALGDMGEHFPDDDPAWADADGRGLLRHVLELCAREGWRVGNADLTVIAERPKLAPHVMAMRENLAADLGIASGRVNVKATTHEGLDSLGRGEALAAHAVVLLRGQESGGG